jgi:hypothetical protein
VAALAGLVLCACTGLPGCAANDKTFAVAGQVTFDGKPVPAGTIYFDPDPKTNPDSPQGFADIKDGHYDTARSGRGTPGGEFTVRIEGFDGRSTAEYPIGRPLFDSYQEKVELPAEDTRKDFRVPASAAQGVRKRPAFVP